MNTADFTPGPWRWAGEQLVGQHFTVARSVAWWNAKDGDRSLIATAPELYGWMERVLGDLSEHSEQQIEELQAEGAALLAKARGERVVA